MGSWLTGGTRQGRRTREYDEWVPVASLQRMPALTVCGWRVGPVCSEADARARCVSDSRREGGCVRGSWAEGNEGKWAGSVI